MQSSFTQIWEKKRGVVRKEGPSSQGEEEEGLRRRREVLATPSPRSRGRRKHMEEEEEEEEENVFPTFILVYVCVCLVVKEHNMEIPQMPLSIIIFELISNSTPTSYQ